MAFKSKALQREVANHTREDPYGQKFIRKEIDPRKNQSITFDSQKYRHTVINPRKSSLLSALKSKNSADIQSAQGNIKDGLTHKRRVASKLDSESVIHLKRDTMFYDANYNESIAVTDPFLNVSFPIDHSDMGLESD